MTFNLLLLIITVVFTNALSVYEATANPTNVLFIIIVNIIGNIVLFSVYILNNYVAVKNKILDSLKDLTSDNNLKPLEKILLENGISINYAMRLEETFGEDGWVKQIDSPNEGDIYLAIAITEQPNGKQIGIAPTLFNADENAWYVMNTKTFEFSVLDNIICFKSLDTLPKDLKDKFSKIGD